MTRLGLISENQTSTRHNHTVDFFRDGTRNVLPAVWVGGDEHRLFVNGKDPELTVVLKAVASGL